MLDFKQKSMADYTDLKLKNLCHMRINLNIVMFTIREKRICIDVNNPENIRAVDIPSGLYSALKDNIALREI
jgi:hypothetical protein